MAEQGSKGVKRIVWWLIMQIECVVAFTFRVGKCERSRFCGECDYFLPLFSYFSLSFIRTCESRKSNHFFQFFFFRFRFFTIIFTCLLLVENTVLFVGGCTWTWKIFNKELKYNSYFWLFMTSIFQFFFRFDDTEKKISTHRLSLKNSFQFVVLIVRRPNPKHLWVIRIHHRIVTCIVELVVATEPMELYHL